MELWSDKLELADYGVPVIVHLNGQLVPAEQARIDPFDRGFLFGDGIYEGLRAFGGHVVGMDLHIRRFAGGLADTRIPFEAGNLAPLTEELLKATGLSDAFVYWQVTRGRPAPGEPVRARVLTGDVRPTVFGYAVPAAPLPAYEAVPTKSAVTTPDTRWLRGKVKSISLLGSVLGGVEAAEAGADDAILIRDTHHGRIVAEATSANLFAVLPGRGGRPELVTPSLDSAPILAGVTRDILIERLPEIVEREVRAEELQVASEVMLVGTMTMVTAITRLDGRVVGDGTPGPVARRLLKELVRAINEGR